MSDVEPVKVSSDNGHKNRWAIGKYFYRQDGKKLTVNKTFLLGGLTVLFVISAIFVLLQSPPDSDSRSPIAFNEASTNVSTIDVPLAAKDSLEARRQRREGNLASVRRYSGLEVVKRPGVGKIPPGAIVKARLVSGGSNGLVKAELIEDLSPTGEVIANTGTVLVGNGSSTEDRLNIDFSKMVSKDGQVESVRAQACDSSDQSVGLKGSKVSRYGAALAAGIGLNFAGGLATGLQETSVQSGVVTRNSDLRNAALNGAATASLETSKDLLEKWKQQKSVIEVKKGTEICVIFSGE